jgi:3,4-dihydroxy 2-butanone 4-phosphate synthase/GTP cyclohydrolase II
VNADTAFDQALADIAAGRIVVLAGDRLRGGDLDLMIAARHVTPAAINFMATYGRGLICLSITPELAKRLSLSLINPGTHRQTGRPFARSIEAASGVSTGISAADRAHTVAVAIAPGSSAADIHSPGHVFPLIAQTGGVLARPSAVEASIELARLADAGDAAVICSIMRDDGEMARIDDIGDLLRDHGLAVADIGTLLARIENAGAERA